MKLLFRILFLGVTGLFLSFFFFGVVSAGPEPPVEVEIPTETEAPTPPTTEPQESSFTSPEAVNLINPLGGSASDPAGTTSIPLIIGGAIKVLLGILGTLALGVFVLGGFYWITSAGNAERVKKGMKMMLYAVVGIFVIFAAYGILSAIFTVLEVAGG